jgi:hypothetical protein
MNRRTQLIIGVTLIAMGMGVYALGLLEEESAVRYVENLHADPEAHQAGDYTLLGIPQPEARVATYQVKEGTVLTTYETELVSHVDGLAIFNVTKTSRQTSEELPFLVETIAWQQLATHAFIVEDFGAGGAGLWAIYDGVLPEELRPKPSQMQGALIVAPEGVLAYRVDKLTVGCSSKFIPEESRAEFDADGDGYADSEIKE